MSSEVSAHRPIVRRGRPGYDSDEVLEIAARLFNERGFDATSVADLAAGLGLAKSAIYHHFDSKDAILARALDKALGGLESALTQAIGTSASAREQLEAIVRGAVRVLVERLPYVTLLLRVRGNSPTELAALQRRRAFDRTVAEIVRAAQDEGAIRADIDPGVATRLIFGMVNSLTEWYRPDGSEDALTLEDDILRVALQGLEAGRSQ